jgi:hypothetical protein
MVLIKKNSLANSIKFPSVSFLIKKNSLENSIKFIVGTGPKNRVLKGDVLAFLKASGPQISDSVYHEASYFLDVDLKLAYKYAGKNISKFLSTATIIASKGFFF